MKTARHIILALGLLLSLPAFSQNDLSLSRKGKDLMLQIPDSLMGRRFIVTTRLSECSDPATSIGANLSKNTVLRFTRVDSSLVITAPGKEFMVRDSDNGIASALAQSKREQVRFVIPIKKWNSDSSVFTIKADKLFTGSDVLNLKGQSSSYGSITSAAIEGSALTLSTANYEGRVAVRREATWKINDKEYLTGLYTTSLSLLEDKDITFRKADSRVGTRTATFVSYSSDGEVRNETRASRYDLSGDRKLTYYIDTLLSPSFREAITAGILDWNDAFVKAGLGEKIEVKLLTPEIDLDDPRISVVTYRGTQSSALQGSIIADERGEIISTNIRIPDDFRTYVRNCSVFSISDVDKRYARYDIADDAVCEVLRASIRKLTGLCLGLTANEAGSYAFSPAQLSDPAFTREHGITASVLDDVLFNVFATEEGVAEGQVCLVDRLGSYDYYAIAWLYADADTDPSQLYIGRQTFALDPRSMMVHEAYIRGTLDLGNDPIANFDAVSRHIENIAATSYEWVSADNVPHDFSTLFADWLFLAKYNQLVILAKQCGSMFATELRQGDEGQRYVAVDEEFQRACLKKFFDALDQFDYVTKDYMQLAGANKGIMPMVNRSVVDMLQFTVRLAAVAMAQSEAGSTYSVDDYMKEVQDGLLANASRGRFEDGEVLMIQQYIARLMTYAPVLRANFNAGMKPAGIALYEVSSHIDGIPMLYLDGMDAVCMKYLKRARGIISKGRKKAKDDITRGEFDFLLLMIDSSLNNL